MERLARAWLVVVVALVCAPGCGHSDSPVGAVKAFVKAARQGDERTALSWLAPAARAELEKSARQATELAGGHRRVGAHSLLSVGLGEPEYEPIGYSEAERSGDHAVVEVHGPGGRVDRVSVIRTDGRWLVELP